MYNDLWLQNKNKKAMDLLLSALVLIMCKRVPSEIDVKRIEKLNDKIRLVKVPAAAFSEERSIGAVVRLTIPVG